MEHLDEGTIHAWLDNQLDAAHGAQVEAHVAACETCRVAVAEARGFMASATRILGALDDVPGDVAPATHTPDVRDIRAVNRSRKWQLLAAAAGLALMATGSWYVSQQIADDTIAVAPSSAELSDGIAETAARERAVAAVPDSPTTGSTRGGDAATTANEPRVRQEVAATQVRDSAPPAPATAPRQGAAQADVAAVPPAVTTQPTTPPAVQSARTVSTAEAREAAAKAQGALQMRAQSGAAAFSPGTVVMSAAGCYVAGKANSETSDLASRAALVPDTLQLTDSVASAGNLRRSVAIDLTARDRVLRWTPLTPGTVRLIIGDSASAPSLTLATDTLPALRGPGLQVLQRIPCPRE